MNERDYKYKKYILKSERKSPFVRSSLRWENNIEIYLKEKAGEDSDWIHFVQNRYKRWVHMNKIIDLRN
jgi:hypothetical protein